MSMTPRSNSAALEEIELMNGAVLRECKVLEIELESAKQRINHLEDALCRIANTDFRGNRSEESQIAAEALKP